MLRGRVKHRISVYAPSPSVVKTIRLSLQGPTLRFETPKIARVGCIYNGRVRAFPLLLLLALCSFGRAPSDRLDPRHLEAIHAQRVQWMKQRSVAALPGIHQDFRSVRASHPVDSLTLVRAARDAGAQVVLTKTPSLSGIHEGVLFLGGPESEKEPLQFPDEPTAD